ncbi:uncharacterized protein CDV56_104681 [Aspergillus thermomutatus]|uniref:Peptidase M3A/M3B catalytic domain-containing protein n=1 Tax=Aspergillus thermomutatus TaxID=41047 RepID=A0A397GEY9_ASPTH|nr:uncharacterized protein CDV56_104681 [Aspergillus thermomutatus]RHZ49501.1 hypothetical protein CDV56_104681 [Aspergillus thermomutatus]
MLENWCWMKDVLKGLSCHYTTLHQNYLADWRKQHPGEPDPPKEIPNDLVESLIKYRYFNRGLYHLYQLSISIFDLQIHSLSTDKEIAGLDLQKLWYDLREEIEGMDFSECRNGFAFGTFAHLTAGYDVHTDWTLRENGTPVFENTINTGQLYFEEEVEEKIMGMEPYASHTQINRTTNAEDMEFSKSTVNGFNPVVSVVQIDDNDLSKGLVGYITLGVDSTAIKDENWPVS